MPIPNVDVFNEFLASLTLRQPEAADADFERLEAIPERFLENSSGPLHAEPVFLWYRKSCTLAPATVIERVRKELDHIGHTSTSDMAMVILATQCLASASPESPVRRLNRIIELIGPADSSQYWISAFPPHPDSHTFHLGRFTIGPLNRQKLVYWCTRLGCDFFDRYPDRFRRRYAIEGAPIVVQVLDWAGFMDSFKIVRGKIGSDILDYYFDCLTSDLQSLFRHEFRVAQEVLVAAGAPYLDLDQPRGWLSDSFVGIYQKIGRNSSAYFCPLNMRTTIDFAQADRRFPAKIEELREKYSFTGLADYEIHQTLETYCRFLVKAITYETENRHDEAFLHYVIALELLFGEKDASTQSVSKRVAIVGSRALGESFQTTIARMKRVYEKRSKYVHAGISVSDHDMELVRPISDKVLQCLLRLQAVPSNRTQGFFEAWLRTLDFFVAAIEAGKEVEDKELVEAGIALSPTEERRELSSASG